MSKSDDNTNELDSYGVWVRSTPGKDQSQLDNQESNSENQEEQKEDFDLDLPDFDDTEFSDMFRDEPKFSVDEQEDDFGSDLDSTLSTDELANITGLGDVAIENVDAEPETDDFDTPPVDDIFNGNQGEGDNTVSENFGLSDNFEKPDMTENNQEEEISLDEFMDDGFSDESVASGNNGYEPGTEKNTGTNGGDTTEEVSLDDFLDGDSFDTDDDESSKASEENNEAPLDMDITFDDSAENVETEDNTSLEEEAFFDNDSDLKETEEEPDFTDIVQEPTVEAAKEDETSDKTDVNLDTEEVDLSDFGIDTNAEETPIVQDVEKQKNKDKVVDYDLFVENDDTSSAPVINEIKKEVPEKTEEQSNVTSVDNDLLRQIVSELSSLKNEINSIKSNIAEIKSKSSVAPASPVCESDEVSDAKNTDNMDDTVVETNEETTTDEIPFPDLVIDTELSDDADSQIPPVEEEKIGNCSNTGYSESQPVNDITEESDAATSPVNIVEEETTDTIPIPEVLEEEEVSEVSDADEHSDSGNAESENNVSDLTEEEITDSLDNEQLPDDDIFTSDDELNIPKDNNEGGFFGNDDTDETIALSGDELSNIMNNAEFSDDAGFAGNNEEENISEDKDNAESAYGEAFDTSIIKDEDIFASDDSDSSLGFNYLDEHLEEPTMDELSMDNLTQEEELPEEINIPKDNDIFVESTSSDFLDSVKDTTDENELNKAELSTADEDIEEISELDEELPTTDSVLEDDLSAGNENNGEIQDIPTVDELVSEDEKTEESEAPVAADLSFDDVDFLNRPVEEDTSKNDETIAEDSEDEFLEVDNLNNDLSTSNINYLTKKDEDVISEEEEQTDINSDLKQEVKSVLLYMDQLLESLPEDKIYEFAKSEEFATYKKLFKDLGLS